MANYEKMYDMIDLALWMQESGEGISLEDIMQRFNVSRRTAERMRNALLLYFPQMEEVDTGERIKRWRIPQRSLNTLLSFSPEELAVFKTAIDLLKQNGIKEKAEVLSKVELKLRNLIKPEQKNRIEPDAEEMMLSEGVICRPGPRINVDEEIIHNIRQAILSCHQIKMVYTKKAGKTSTYTLVPYGLLYGQRNHYLIAKHSDGYDGGRPRNFSITGIQSVEILPETFNTDNFSLKDYAEESFGAWHEEPFDVEWLFDKEAATEAKNFIFHPKQELVHHPDGTLTVKFRAGGRVEMDWHLYTWGEHVKVIKPENWEEMRQV